MTMSFLRSINANHSLEQEVRRLKVDNPDAALLREYLEEALKGSRVIEKKLQEETYKSENLRNEVSFLTTKISDIEAACA